MGQIADYYRDYKRERSLLDYDDLLSYLRELLRGHPELAERLSRTFHYIMVDEYQDTNRLQADIVRLLAHSHDNVMAVGDDAQSIYSFRGATVRNIFEFPDLFPGTKVIKLEENYRSTQPILDLSNEIILQAKESYTKNLFTRREAGIRPVLVEADSERYQSRFVGQKILELHESGVPLPEIAVLFRSSFHSFRSGNRAGPTQPPVRQTGRLQIHRNHPHQGRAGPSADYCQPPGRGLVVPRPAAARTASEPRAAKRSWPRCSTLPTRSRAWPTIGAAARSTRP